MKLSQKNINRERRHRSIRAKIKGTKVRPRLSVFRSNRYLFIQLIDDSEGRTLISVGDANKKLKIDQKHGKIAAAAELGKLLAQTALKLGIKEAVFDRGGYKYHGRVKAAAEGARQAGLQF